MIAGGGTGGHLFPGIAVAEELVTRHPKNEVVFVGTNRGLERRIVPAAGYKLEMIGARGLKGVGPLRLLRALIALPISFVKSWFLLRRYRPDVVVGVGGYSSGPVVLIAFDEARPFFPAGKVQLTGNPIRRQLLDNYLRSRLEHDRFSVLIFGGSQGSQAINDRVLESLDSLADLKDQIHFVHQPGNADLARVRSVYAQKGFSAEVLDFIDDMSSAYAKVELVVCRAGATTLAELTVCKKASILIPFPYATDNHQEVNARAMVEGGAALMLRESELTGPGLAGQIRALKEHPDLLRKMERQAGLLGRPEAAKELADICVQLMVKTWGAHGRARKNGMHKSGART